MSNLLQETIQSIEQSGHTPEDIIFIGSPITGHQCTWEEYKKLANREYDSGYGDQEVAKDLVIVFKDKQTMWRYEYDGSESWDFSAPFKPPKEKKPIINLIGSYWPDLEDLQTTEVTHNNPNPPKTSRKKT